MTQRSAFITNANYDQDLVFFDKYGAKTAEQAHSNFFVSNNCAYKLTSVWRNLVDSTNVELNFRFHVLSSVIGLCCFFQDCSTTNDKSIPKWRLFTSNSIKNANRSSILISLFPNLKITYFEKPTTEKTENYTRNNYFITILNYFIILLFKNKHKWI